MYENLLKQLKPKPKMNLKFYKGSDKYSEGAVEDKLIELIASAPEEDYTEIISQNYSWSSYYHLTHIRKNLLNWYPFAGGDLLEIGCGLGAFTNLFCEKCDSVTAVELSQRRATATLLRCRERENLEIIVGDLNDIEFDKQFDYITLIGVLEYQGNFSDSKNPYLDFLRTIRKLLKSNGKLLVAIENQYGLKYWCGAAEDHTGKPFDGLNQYELSNAKSRTFSKAALDDLLGQAGFDGRFFYYPMPDYKLPTVIYSEKELPKDENMFNLRPYYIPNNKSVIAPEMKIYKDVIANNVFEFFANSFLVECSKNKKENLGEITFVTHSTFRQPEYRISTCFDKHGRVYKKAADGRGVRHLEETAYNEYDLYNHGLSILQSEMKDGDLVADYCDLPTAEQYALGFLRDTGLSEEKKLEQFDKLMEKWVNDILKSSDLEAEENIVFELIPDLPKTPENYSRFGPVLKTGYIDMVFRNAFMADGELAWFDQEWMMENIPARYIIWRGLGLFHFSYPEDFTTGMFHKYLVKYGVYDCHEEFSKIDSLFNKSVIDAKAMAERNNLPA